MNIYENVKTRIEKSGSNIKRFERENNMANGTIMKWKSRGNPRISTLEKVADALGVKVSELLE